MRGDRPWTRSRTDASLPLTGPGPGGEWGSKPESLNLPSATAPCNWPMDCSRTVCVEAGQPILLS